MSYYKVLGLEREPFATTPDPAFFYQSKEHKAALYRLRVAIELKRGLSIILGDVGTGKTTLSRRLAQILQSESDLIMAVVLNPVYDTPEQFLIDLMERFHLTSQLAPGKEPSTLECLKVIERFLFEQSVERKLTVILLIDEAQKLTEPCLEILRALLNYETNEFKILQLILMGQMELLPRLLKLKNFWDRVALKYVINPLDEAEVSELIRYRLHLAGHVSRRPLFDNEAVSAIYDHTQGYPRKVGMLCHDALEYLVMHNKDTVDREIIREITQAESRLLYGAAAS